MDPNQTLNELLLALGDRDWDRTDELQQALVDWIEKGGFPPLTLGPRELGRQWHKSLARFVCRAAAFRVMAAKIRRSLDQ